MKGWLISVLVGLASMACVTSSMLPTATGVTPTARSLALPPSHTPEATETPIYILCARVTVETLHVREKANYEADVLGWFSRDTIVEVEPGDDGQWWPVSGRGIDYMGRERDIEGYVRARYLEVCACHVRSKFNTQRYSTGL